MNGAEALLAMQNGKTIRNDEGLFRIENGIIKQMSHVTHIITCRMTEEGWAKEFGSYTGFMEGEKPIRNLSFGL